MAGGRLPSAKKRRGLTPALRRALDGDVLEDDLDRGSRRRSLDDDDDDDDDAPLVDGDDEMWPRCNQRMRAGQQQQ